MSEHDQMMRQSLLVAREAMASGDHPFGAILVRDGAVLLTARNTIFSGSDVTAHAELNLVRQSTERYDAEFLAGCTLYTSTEPCAMCTGAIVWSGIGGIVYGCPAEKLGEITGEGRFVVPCRHILAYAKAPPQVTGPILEEETAAIHHSYWPQPENRRRFPGRNTP